MWGITHRRCAGHRPAPNGPFRVEPTIAGAAPLPPMEPGGSDRPMLVLVSGMLLLGGIALFIAWGLSHAYPGV